VDGFALPDGRACAFKIDDGAARGRVPVTVALLRRLGGGAVPGADLAVLDELGTSAVTGGGRVVGEIRAAPQLVAW
jgi:L-asparaginase II